MRAAAAPARGAAVVEAGGRVFAIGGRARGRVTSPHIALAEFDCATGAAVTPMPGGARELEGVPGRTGHAAAGVGGTVVVFGGEAVAAGPGDGALLGDAWIVTPASGAVAPVVAAPSAGAAGAAAPAAAAAGAPPAAAPPARKFAAAAATTARGADVVVVFGGVGAPVAAAPAPVVAAKAGAAKPKASAAAAAAVAASEVPPTPAVSIGGLAPLGDGWVLDVGARAWTQLPSGPRPRFHASLTRLGAGGVLALFGGTDGLTELGDLWTLSPPTAEGGAWAWTEVVTVEPGRGPGARAGHAAAFARLPGVDAPALLVFGGHGAGGRGGAPSVLHAFDPASRAWATVDAGGPPPSPRIGAGLVPLYGPAAGASPRAGAGAIAAGLLLVDGRCVGDGPDASPPVYALSVVPPVAVAAAPAGPVPVTLPNGDVYTGEWADGARAGRGSCVYANGDSCVPRRRRRAVGVVAGIRECILYLFLVCVLVVRRLLTRAPRGAGMRATGRRTRAVGRARSARPRSAPCTRGIGRGTGARAWGASRSTAPPWGRPAPSYTRANLPPTCHRAPAAARLRTGASTRASGARATQTGRCVVALRVCVPVCVCVRAWWYSFQCTRGARP